MIFLGPRAKSCHAVPLCQIEQGEIQTYTQVDQIDRIRRVHAQRLNFWSKWFKELYKA